MNKYMTASYEQHLEFSEEPKEGYGSKMFATFINHIQTKGGFFAFNAKTNVMSQMMATATSDFPLKVALNGIEKCHIFVCAFCGAANHCPLNILENYSIGKESLTLNELSSENIRCGMCAGDLMMSIKH